MSNCKEYVVDPKGCDNLARALFRHAKSINGVGQHAVERYNVMDDCIYIGEGPHDNEGLVVGYCTCDSHRYERAKKLSPREFFRLTEDDLVSEPKLSTYAIVTQDSDNTDCILHSYKLTKYEVDDIRHYIEKMVQERES